MGEGLRLGAVRVTAELMYDLFRASPPGQWFRVEDGLPPDALYVRSYYDDRANEFVFIYTHPTFPLTPPGCVVSNVSPPRLSSLQLTLPFTPAQRECIEGLILRQSQKAGGDCTPDAVVGG